MQNNKKNSSQELFPDRKNICHYRSADWGAGSCGLMRNVIGPGILTGGQGGVTDMIERDTTTLPYLGFLLMLVFEKLKM